MQSTVPYMPTRFGVVCLLWGMFAQHAAVAGPIADSPTVTLVGRVLDAEGAPLDGFTLTVYQRGSEPQIHRFESTEGRLEMDLEAGGFGIALDAPGHATWFDEVRFRSTGTHEVVEGRSVTVVSDEHTSVALLAEPLGRLSGWISGLRGSERASVFIRSDDEWQDRIRGDRSEFGNGSFVVHGIPEGDHVVEVTARMQGDSRWINKRIRMAGGMAKADFNFAGRSRIKGRVLAGSRPVGAVLVRAVPKDPTLPSAADMSNVDGGYEILGLGDGEYDIRAQLGLRGTERSFGVSVVPHTTFDVRLGPFALSGTVTLASDSSYRLANWVVQARLISASPEPGYERAPVRWDGAPIEIELAPRNP